MQRIPSWRTALVSAAVALLHPALSLAQSPPAAQREFEVASIKRNLSGDVPIRLGPINAGRFRAANIPIQELITMAYRIRDFQLSGAPAWLRSERYDIDAKTASKAGYDNLMAMLQPLLEDRFQFKFHIEQKEMLVYSLAVTKPGKLMEAAGECPPPSDELPDPARLPHGPCGFLFILPGHLAGQKVALSWLVDALSRLTDRVVLDRTGLTGKYDIDLNYTPERAPFQPPGNGPGLPPPPGMPALPPFDPNGPSLFTALQERLGLKLESQKGPVPIMVIDHVERPSAN